MRVRNAFVFAAAAVASLASVGTAVAPAQAAPADVVLVGYSDLNLASSAGQRTLDSRISAAVDLVCNDGGSFDLRSNSLSRSCRTEAAAAAQAQRDAAVAGQRSGSVRVSTAAN